MTPVDDRDEFAARPSGLAGSALALVTREVGRVPLFALSVGLQAWQRTRGIRALAVRRGGEVLQIAAYTPIGRFLPQQVLDDGADEEAVRIASDAKQATTPQPAPEQLKISEPASPPDLPIANFDNVSLGSLRARLRSLSVEDLVTLREWEQAHAHRLPVITLLDNRITKVSAGATTTTAYPADTGASDNGRVRR
jgi:hypothetical protein